VCVTQCREALVDMVGFSHMHSLYLGLGRLFTAREVNQEQLRRHHGRIRVCFGLRDFEHEDGVTPAGLGVHLCRTHASISLPSP
jgi:hypothetical protein